jgi:hypothetical protein
LVLNLILVTEDLVPNLILVIDLKVEIIIEEIITEEITIKHQILKQRTQINGEKVL